MVLSRQLSKLYYNPTFPGGFRGEKAFYQEAKKKLPNLKRKQLSDFLQKQEAYTLHKQIVKPKTYRRVYTKGINYLWQADLLDFQSISEENNGFRYICCVIDTFSKMLWTFPLKNKSGPSLVKALSQHFLLLRPIKLQVDKGTEFYNKNFKKMLEAYGILMYSTHSDKKASIVERVQRTLRNRLGKIWTRNKNKRWVDVLPKITSSYNNSIHRSIKMRPINVKPKHTKDILTRLYPIETTKKRKIKAGDLVRITVFRRTFRKESDIGWTKEVFLVKKVVKSAPITYILQDLMGEDIKGGFYFEEIEKIG